VPQPAWWRHLYRGEQEALRFLAVLGAAAVGGGVLLVVLAWGTASLVFAGLQTLFAFLAFIAAAGAFWATWPQFRAFVAKPKVQWWVDWAETQYQPPERAPHHVVFTVSEGNLSQDVFADFVFVRVGRALGAYFYVTESEPGGTSCSEFSSDDCVSFDGLITSATERLTTATGGEPTTDTSA
jgi:hypothetical protein